MQYNGIDKHKQALFEGKQDKLTAGTGIALTPLQDGTVRIDAEGGGVTGTITDVNVNGVSVVVDGVAEIDLSGYAQSVDLANVATSGDYTDLINKPAIPDELADLMDDSTHRVVTDTQISTWNAKSDFSGSYNDLTDKPTLGTASAKDYTTSVTQNSNDLVTSGAVFNAIDNLPVPMIFKGTLGTGGTITALPTAAVSNEGYTYKVITAGTYASQSANIGDVFVSNGTDWVLIPAGDETFTDTWREIKLDGVSVLGSSINTGALNLKAGINMGIAVDGNTLTFSATDTTYSDATQSVHGLMSTSDKVKLDGIESGAEVNVQSDWNQTTSSAKDFIKNKPNINNGILTIQKNGTTIQTFSANQSESATANITLTKSDVGLGNVDNTADANKNVNSATRLTKTETVLSTDKVPYVLRASLSPEGFSGYIREKLIGGSIAWNQIIQVSATNLSKTENGVTITDNRDGTFTISTTNNGATADTYQTGKTIQVISGHKYYYKSLCTVGSSSTYYSYIISGGISNQIDVGNGAIYNSTSSEITNNVIIFVKRGTIITTPIKFSPICIDLTLMFGSTIADYIYNLETATAGAGIAKLKEWGFFTKDYYNYDAGSIQNVCTSGKRIVGFNQWDEQWELGKINTSTGSNVTSDTQIRSKNFIPVLNELYYIKGNFWIIFYDANKNIVTDNLPVGSATDNYGKYFINQSMNINNDKIKYIKFYCINNYGTIYNNDICINISDPAKNGTYEPYHLDSISLSSTELCGIPKLDTNNNLYYDGDEYTSDGNVNVRYGELTFDGSENWVYLESQEYFYILLTDSKFSGNVPKASNSTNIISNLVSAGLNGIYTGSLALAVKKNSLPSTVSDLASFTTWLSNNNLVVVYELATPTEETVTEYQNPQWSKVGTEEFVDGLTRDMIVPVGHVTEYMGATAGEYQYIPTMPVDSGKYNLVTDGYYMEWEKQKKPWILASAFTMKWGENKKHDIDNLRTIYYNIPIDDADSMKTKFVFHWYNVNEDTEGEYVYEVDATSLYSTSYGLTIPTANWDYKYINITIDKVYIESGSGTIGSGCRLAVQVYYRFEYSWC